MGVSRVALFRRLQLVLSLLLAVFVAVSVAADTEPQETTRPVYEPDNQNVVVLPSPSAQDASPTGSGNAPTSTAKYSVTNANILHDLHSALSTMQEDYFAVWLGKYTSAIDWTGAVMSTYVSATLSTLSHSLSYTMPGTFDKSRKLDVEAQMVENEINKYFAQTSAYYFGEDHFAIRNQAFDDILWVVLGWLEASMFVESHSNSHYTKNAVTGKGWHANQFVPAFAHRARVFYELAEKGWDWRLCGGGMTWNPRLLPYKNAITNQLFISASVNMYLHFPGDENCSPFLSQYDPSKSHSEELYDDCDQERRGRYDPVYLANAVNGYEWLKNSGMINDQGLYADGFHIAGYRTNHSKTTCDERNEMVYTYNQGVVLSGIRGLWEATGKISYLEDGHELVRNVIRATGWTKDVHLAPSFSTVTQHDKVSRDENQKTSDHWAGLGANGILTELCDPSGHCNQDGQTFKGIFFHHLTAFCEPLPTIPTRIGRTHAATRELAMLHKNSCREYTPWVIRNAQAALGTRDERGRFGSWWGASESESESQNAFTSRHADEMYVRENATDYRNAISRLSDEEKEMYVDQRLMASSSATVFTSVGADDYNDDSKARRKTKRHSGDLNDRGRGRTVETQGSGLSVVRAMLMFVKRAESDSDGQWDL